MKSFVSAAELDRAGGADRGHERQDVVGVDDGGFADAQKIGGQRRF